MNDTFNFKRFSEYFTLELKETFRNHALTIAICSMAPVILFIITALIALASDNSSWGIECYFTDIIAAIVSVMFLLGFPIQCYGKLTGKKEGSSFLMTPVSGKEKFTAMVLISVFIVPLIFFVVYMLADYLLFICFPPRVDYPLFPEMIPEWRTDQEGNFIGIDIPTLTCFFMPFMVSSAGLCGAFLFKKGKYAKTFLVSAASFIVFASLAIYLADVFDSDRTSEMIFKWGYIAWQVFQTIVGVCCLAYVYRKSNRMEF